MLTLVTIGSNVKKFLFNWKVLVFMSHKIQTVNIITNINVWLKKIVYCRGSNLALFVLEKPKSFPKISEKACDHR